MPKQDHESKPNSLAQLAHILIPILCPHLDPINYTRLTSLCQSIRATKSQTFGLYFRCWLREGSNDPNKVFDLALRARQPRILARLFLTHPPTFFDPVKVVEANRVLVMLVGVGDVDLVKTFCEFVDNRRNAYTRSGKGVPPIMIRDHFVPVVTAALKCPFPREVLEYIIQMPGNSPENTLSVLVKRGDVELIEWVLMNYPQSVRGESKPDLPRCTSSGPPTPLQIATLNGHVDLVRLLLDYGAPMEHHLVHLALASKFKWKEIVELLVQRGANIHHEGEQALWTAIRHKNSEMVDTLLRLGADINGDEDAVLIRACESKSVEFVRKAMDLGANVNARSGAALITAVWLGHEGVVQVLLDHGADVVAQKRLAIRTAEGFVTAPSKQGHRLISESFNSRQIIRDKLLAKLPNQVGTNCNNEQN
ncbi:ankyrin repeat-containing domain protein [Cladochytrium replicatum]|nr:ankyrin repeat-containing domain protein [Cladochytrium replicatum]